MSKFLKAIVNIVLLVAILSAGALLIPPLLGVMTKVSDGTGNTNLSQGSVTYATSTQASQLETGDRILQDDSSGSYVYTVTSIAADTSTYTLTDEVSGDTQEQQLSGGVQKVVLTVPVIGMLSLTLQSREGIIILGLCVAFLIILFILSEVWRKDDEEETEEDEGDEEDEAEAEAEEEDSEKPLTRKEKRRLKKEARRKAREEDDDDVTEEDGEFPEESSENSEEKEVTASGDEAPENGEDAETDREDSEDKMTVRPLEEEPEESTVVDTGSLPAAARNSAEEEQSGEIPDTMTEKEDTEEDESEELERSLAEAVGALLRGESPEGEEDAAESETASEENEEIPEAEEAPETTEEEAEAEETSEAVGGESAEEEELSESEAQPEEAAEEPEEDRDPEEPVELAMPILTAEELLKKAEEAGDHPKVIEDEETGVTILDYSDIL